MKNRSIPKEEDVLYNGDWKWGLTLFSLGYIICIYYAYAIHAKRANCTDYCTDKVLMFFLKEEQDMSEKKATKKRLCITLDEEIYQKLKDIAEFDHTTMSQWVTDRVVEAVRSTEYQELTFR